MHIQTDQSKGADARLFTRIYASLVSMYCSLAQGHSGYGLPQYNELRR